MGALLTRYRDNQEDLYRPNPRLLRSVIMIRSRNICYICSTHFKTKTRLDEHMQRCHPKETYTCDDCNLICKTWPKFQKHIYILHDDLAFCTYCYKAFRNYWNLVRHWQTHEPFECEICNDTFLKLSDLTRHHAALHRNVPFQQRLSSFFRRFTRQE